MVIESLRDQYVSSARHFSRRELFGGPEFAPDEELIFGPVVAVADAVRDEWGPLVCRSGVRTEAKKQDLIRQGYRPAEWSPHTIGRCAMDLDVDTQQEAKRLAAHVKDVSERLSIPTRIGLQRYLDKGYSFVHIDTAPLLADEAYDAGVINDYAHQAWTNVMSW